MVSSIIPDVRLLYLSSSSAALLSIPVSSLSYETASAKDQVETMRFSNLPLQVGHGNNVGYFAHD